MKGLISEYDIRKWRFLLRRYVRRPGRRGKSCSTIGFPGVPSVPGGRLCVCLRSFLTPREGRFHKCTSKTIIIEGSDAYGVQRPLPCIVAARRRCTGQDGPRTFQMRKPLNRVGRKQIFITVPFLANHRKLWDCKATELRRGAVPRYVGWVALSKPREIVGRKAITAGKPAVMGAKALHQQRHASPAAGSFASDRKFCKERKT